MQNYKNSQSRGIVSKTIKGRRRNLSGPFMLVLGYGMVFGAANSYAQPQPSKYDNSVLEEITVTARKRKESLQRTPIAVAAFSKADLEKRNLTNLMQVMSFIPNVTVSSTARGGGGPSANVYIRGVGQDDFLFTTDPGVGIYIDGVYFPRTIGGVMDLLDLKRVEVLRGPQGTLFGKNTIGGAINIISAKPTGETGGMAEVTVGGYNRIDTRGNFDFPIIKDQLFAKISFSTKNRDGYGNRLDFATKKILDKGLGNQNQTAVRAAIRWLPSDRITVDISADYSKWKQNSAPTVVTKIDISKAFPTLQWNEVIGIPSGLPYDSRFLIPGNVNDSYGTGPNGVSYDGWGVSGTVKWDLDDVVAKSITAYRGFKTQFGRDGDGSPLPIVATNDKQKQHQFSEEIQFVGNSFDGRLHWQAGGFYFSEYDQDRNQVRLISGMYKALEALPGPLSSGFGGAGNFLNHFLDLDLDIFNEMRISSIAGFGQATFDITDKLSLTGGLRYTHEKKDYTLRHRRIASGLFIVPLTTVSNSWNAATPMANLQYQWTDNIMSYVSFARGFKSGGFNGRPTESALVETFNPEYVSSYEIGVKSQFLDNRLRLNLDAFYMNYTDMQVNVISFSKNTGSLVLRTSNIGAARIKGVEMDFQAIPIAGMRVGGNLGYLSFRINQLDPTVVGVTMNSKGIRAPKWTMSAYAEYSWDIRNNGRFTVRGDWTYESASFSDITNTPSIIRKAHSIFNARLSYQMLQGQWEISLFGSNLTDKRFINSASSDLNSFGFSEAIYNRPREWGLSIKKTF